MKKTELIMGMPITVEVVDVEVQAHDIEKVFGYFNAVDEKFSPYKINSEVSKINLGKIQTADYSQEMKEVIQLSEQTKHDTQGYFDVWHHGKFDPSGLVKGWAINNAAKILTQQGWKNFYVEAGGDIQTFGKNAENQNWKIGIKNPFNQDQIIKIINLSGEGIATSGSYIRGQHIYNPFNDTPITDIVSLTVIGPNIYEADRFATAAYAMGKKGIEFIEQREELEGYIVDKNGVATMTSGFEKYLSK